jgi:hypothetical protein
MEMRRKEKEKKLTIDEKVGQHSWQIRSELWQHEMNRDSNLTSNSNKKRWRNEVFRIILIGTHAIEVIPFISLEHAHAGWWQGCPGPLPQGHVQQ